MQADRGDWIQTAMGRQFWPISPRADEVFIDDISHALSMLCRFGGHCTRFYSVAEHSVLLSRAATGQTAQVRLWALMHDASEAYIVDVPRPLKPFLTGYRASEDAIMAVVCERFGMDPEMPAIVKQLDTAILTDEMQQNMATPPARWATETTPLGMRLQYWQPHRARSEFLAEFHNLSRIIGAKQ